MNKQDTSRHLAIVHLETYLGLCTCYYACIGVYV